MSHYGLIPQWTVSNCCGLQPQRNMVCLLIFLYIQCYIYMLPVQQYFGIVDISFVLHGYKKMSKHTTFSCGWGPQQFEFHLQNIERSHDTIYFIRGVGGGTNKCAGERHSLRVLKTQPHQQCRPEGAASLFNEKPYIYPQHYERSQDTLYISLG